MILINMFSLAVLWGQASRLDQESPAKDKQVEKNGSAQQLIKVLLLSWNHRFMTLKYWYKI